MPTWVNVIIAVLSVGLSAVAAWYARRSANSAKVSETAALKSADAATETAQVDRESWHAQRAPKLSVRVEKKGAKGSEAPMITIANLGDTNCDSVSVTVGSASGFRQAIHALRVPSGGFFGPWEIAKLYHGDEVSHEITPPDPHGGRTIVRCVCRDAMGEEWTIRLPLDSDADYDVGQSVW